MQLVVIFIIIFVIIVIISIVWCILQIFFAFLFLLSANAVLFIEKCFFISNAIPPWVTWGIFGLFIGLLLAAYKSASHSSYRHLRPLFIILPILVLVGLGTYNANRLRESSEKITHPDPKTSQPKRYSPAKAASQKTQNLCFATVPSDRWKGEYYNNKNLSGSPSMVRDDGNGFIHFDWGNYSPGKDCGIDADNFSVRWMRTVYFEGGTYRFTATADGFNLYIDDVLRLERWHDQFYAYTVDVPLATGNHAIKMEYYNDDRSDFVKLSWQVLSTPIQSSVAVNIAGEWEGKVDNMPAKLSITQNGNSLSGNIVYDNIKEYLSGEINSDQIILRGTHHDGEIKEGKSFALDTFSGIISSQDDEDFILGNYTDEAGHSGSWFVIKPKTLPTVLKEDMLKPKDQVKRTKLTLTKLTEDIKDAKLFNNKSQVFYYKYDDVWSAVEYVLEDQNEKVIQSDKETGVVITDTSRWFMNREYFKYYILVERINNVSSELHVKLLAYDSVWDSNLKRSFLEPMNESCVNTRITKFLKRVNKRLKNKQ